MRSCRRPRASRESLWGGSAGVRVARLCAALALTVLWPAPAAPLDPRLVITQLTHRVWQDELPQSTVHSVVQTKDGYLWIGTYEGLARFDGVRFTVFDLQRTHDLQGTSALHLHEDSRGRLWVATNGGLTFVENGVFRTYGLADGLPSRMVRVTHETPDGTLWIGTDRGLATLRGGKLVARPELVPGEVWALASERDGSLWVGAGNGLFHVTGDSAQHIGSVRRLGTEDGLPSAVCRVLHLDRRGALWVGTDAGLARKGDKGFDVYRADDGLGDGYVRAIAEDGDGSLWVGTEGAGLVRLRGGESKATAHFERYASAEGLTNNYVRSIFEDREGSLWVGTNGGLNRFSEGKFTVYGKPEGLTHDFVRAIFEDQAGVVWMGTDGGGVSRLERGQWSSIGTAQGLSHPAVRAIAQTPDGALWFGTRDGLDRYADGRLSAYGARLPNRLVRALYVDKAGTLWIGAEAGGLVHLEGDRMTVLTTADGLGADDVRAIHEDRKGRLWIGTFGGGVSVVDAVDGQKRQVTTYRVRDGLPNDIVFCFHEDADGNLWVGTDTGLALYRNGAFTRFGIAQGLYDEKVFRILEDGRGELWMSSNRGIYRASRQQLLEVADGKRTTVDSPGYGKTDGMRANQCNGTSQPAGWQTRDGHLWFPTTAGVVEVDPEHLRFNPLPPPVHVEEIRVDGKKMDLRNLPVFPAELERLEIDFTALSFVAPEKVTFRYRLGGLDRGWIDAGTRRTAYYTHLPSGEYRFEVTGANNDGLWNEGGAAIAFKVATPLARTWWAYLLYVLAGVAVIWSLVRIRLSGLARANALLEARVAERTAALDEKVHQLEESERRAHESELRALEASRAKSVFLSNMSHELRTPLNSIIGFAQILESRSDDLSDRHRRFLGNIYRSGLHLLQLINDLLDLSKIEAGRMDVASETFDPAAVLHEVREVMRGVSAEKGIEIVLDVPGWLPSLTADERKLRQVLLNLVSNAVKFSPAGGTVTIRAAPLAAPESPLDVDGLRIDVVDRGIGIAKKDQELIFEEFRQVESDLTRRSEGTGLGLALVRRLLDLLGGRIVVESELGMGSAFTVFLPRNTPPRSHGHRDSPHVVIAEKVAAGWKPSGPRTPPLQDGPVILRSDSEGAVSRLSSSAAPLADGRDQEK